MGSFSDRTRATLWRSESVAASSRAIPTSARSARSGAKASGQLSRSCPSLGGAPEWRRRHRLRCSLGPRLGVHRMNGDGAGRDGVADAIGVGDVSGRGEGNRPRVLAPRGGQSREPIDARLEDRLLWVRLEPELRQLVDLLDDSVTLRRPHDGAGSEASHTVVHPSSRADEGRPPAPLTPHPTPSYVSELSVIQRQKEIAATVLVGDKPGHSVGLRVRAQHGGLHGSGDNLTLFVYFNAQLSGIEGYRRTCTRP